MGSGPTRDGQLRRIVVAYCCVAVASSIVLGAGQFAGGHVTTNPGQGYSHVTGARDSPFFHEHFYIFAFTAIFRFPPAPAPAKSKHAARTREHLQASAISDYGELETNFTSLQRSSYTRFSFLIDY